MVNRRVCFLLIGVSLSMVSAARGQTTIFEYDTAYDYTKYSYSGGGYAPLGSIGEAEYHYTCGDYPHYCEAQVETWITGATIDTCLWGATLENNACKHRNSCEAVNDVGNPVNERCFSRALASAHDDGFHFNNWEVRGRFWKISMPAGFVWTKMYEFKNVVNFPEPPKSNPV